MYRVTFGEDSATLSIMCHFIDSADITRTVFNFFRTTKLICFFICMTFSDFKDLNIVGHF